LIIFKTFEKMKNVKINLANIQGKLSRAQMKKVLGGLVPTMECYDSRVKCSYYESGTGEITGHCLTNSANNCVCKGPNSSILSTQCDSQAVEE
jgi:hypothetical protein